MALTIGDWKRLPDGPLRFAPFCVAHRDWIYQFAGWDTTSPTDIGTIFRARVLADGSLTAWEHIGDMPNVGDSQTGVISGGYVYITAGEYTNNAAGLANANLNIAKINEDGSLGPWRTDQKVPRSSTKPGLNTGVRRSRCW